MRQVSGRYSPCGERPAWGGGGAWLLAVALLNHKIGCGSSLRLVAAGAVGCDRPPRLPLGFGRRGGRGVRLFKRVDSIRVLFVEVEGPKFVKDHRNKDVRILTGVVGDVGGQSSSLIPCADAREGLSVASREAASYLADGWSRAIPNVVEPLADGLRVIHSRRRVMDGETGEVARLAGLEVAAGCVVEWQIWVEGRFDSIPTQGQRVTIGRGGEIRLPVENFRGLVASAEAAAAVSKTLCAARLVVIEISENGELHRWASSLAGRARPLVYSQLWNELGEIIPESRRRREVLRAVMDAAAEVEAGGEATRAGGEATRAGGVSATMREAIRSAQELSAKYAARPKRAINLGDE